MGTGKKKSHKQTNEILNTNQIEVFIFAASRKWTIMRCLSYHSNTEQFC